MEQSDVSVEVRVNVVPPPRPLSEETRASLEAVRVAREAARLRARRQTMQTRIWFLTVVGAVGLVAYSFGPRVARWRHARAQAAAAASTSASAQPSPTVTAAQAERAAQATTPRAAEAAIANANASATPARTAETPDLDRSAAKPSPVVAPGKTRTTAQGAAAADEACDTGLIRSAPWRLSRDACARAFESDPRNAALALAIAHAEHAHARVDEAAQWAQRALALDGNAAEAYVLIARAEVANGRHEDARAAYRHYLDLAPRGWHKAEARTALRRANDSADR